MRCTAGVDVGSAQTKAVIVEVGRIVGRALCDTGADLMRAAEDVFAEALKHAGVSRRDVGKVIGTGYGRFKVAFGDAQVTEITCHALGAAHLFPGVRMLLDMGGQDTKAIRVGPGGEVLDFCMNDKCAAGTGRALDEAAAAVGIPVSELGPLALKRTTPVRISATCAVFAGSEILSWLGRGRRVEDVLWGLHEAMALRAAALLGRVGVEDEIVFSGGVARNAAMVRALEERLGKRLHVSDEAAFMGALGAALWGAAQ